MSQFPLNFLKIFLFLPACFRIKKCNEENTKAAAYLIRHLDEQDIDLPPLAEAKVFPTEINSCHKMKGIKYNEKNV